MNGFFAGAFLVCAISAFGLLARKLPFSSTTGAPEAGALPAAAATLDIPDSAADMFAIVLRASSITSAKVVEPSSSSFID
eukprot:CAMPEP_0179007414 /NCGR_PEP_ID=MMETSP0795-20121207/15148_1 /TAXON_ID=88552 /ORGANISM="Amoebophrya sp., Strain Ameob2" /LENGTH=79 /DNA_ID=CAMNT_0020702387 /DNA_START=330 /DNA_END=569 /DNA_ORIENTATION=+